MRILSVLPAYQLNFSAATVAPPSIPAAKQKPLLEHLGHGPLFDSHFTAPYYDTYRVTFPNHSICFRLHKEDGQVLLWGGLPGVGVTVAEGNSYPKGKNAREMRLIKRFFPAGHTLAIETLDPPYYGIESTYEPPTKGRFNNYRLVVPLNFKTHKVTCMKLDSVPKGLPYTYHSKTFTKYTADNAPQDIVTIAEQISRDFKEALSLAREHQETLKPYRSKRLIPEFA